MKNDFHVFSRLFAKPIAEQLFKTIFSARLGLALCVALFTTSAAFARTIDLSTEPPSAGDTILVKNGDVLTDTLDGSERPYKVVVASGASVTLNNAAINGITTNENYTWAGISCLGNCDILLAEGSKNYVHGFNKAPGIFVPQKATLTIDGDGELEAVGDWSATGIGGGMIGDLRKSGSIVINGGTINATGDYGAGIGCGPAGSGESSCEDIVINGGNIKAQSLHYGAGIGGGYGSSGGNITITGGTIEASCGFVGAGIGAGNTGKVKNILITGGTVSAMGANYAVGIGAASGGSCGNITIGENVTQVTATKGKNASYCVGGYSGNVGVITVSGVVTGNISSSPFVYPQKTYTVVFDKNEGSGEMANQTAYYDSELPLSLNTYTREGYLFAGWNTQPDGSGDAYTDGAKVLNLANANETVTLYAQWFNGDVSMLKIDIVVENGMVLKGKLSSNVSISIAADAEVTLDGLTIEGVDDENFMWAGISCNGNCKINLAEGSKNVVKGFDYRFPGIFFNTRSTLTIDGNGSLEASSNGQGAGIGAASVSWGYCGNVVIEGGNITATGGRYAAGIGGSRESNCGNIVIKGGNITATGGDNSAGIGASYESNCGNIVIEGGNITATGGGDYSAGIGGGYRGSCINIEIKGGVVNAQGSWGGAGIGSGSNGACGNIKIADGSITAIGGAGIGCGDYASCGNIEITGGSISASAIYLGREGAGIGCGKKSTCGNIDIKGGSIIAKGVYTNLGLGCNDNTSCGYVAISGEKTRVTAIKGEHATYSIGLNENFSAEGTEIEGLLEGPIVTSPYVYPPLLRITEKDGKKYASINGAYDGLDAFAIEENIEVENVVFDRTFPKGAYSTTVLPFSVNTEKVDGLDAVLRYNGIGKDKNNNDAIRMKVVWATSDWVARNQITDGKGNLMQYAHTDLAANTPYLMQMNSETFKVNGNVTIVPTAEAVTKFDEWEWEFRGTWQYKKWNAGDSELGYAYGFAASDATGISVGDFVKVGEGAWISPLRAYLVSNNIPVQAIRANGNYVMRPSAVRKELPELMSVVVDNEDGNEEHTTVIGHFNTRTGEFRMNNAATKRTFDVKGRNVGDKANKARGAFYGKKVLK